MEIVPEEGESVPGSTEWCYSLDGKIDRRSYRQVGMFPFPLREVIILGFSPFYI